MHQIVVSSVKKSSEKYIFQWVILIHSFSQINDGIYIMWPFPPTRYIAHFLALTSWGGT